MIKKLPILLCALLACTNLNASYPPEIEIVDDNKTVINSYDNTDTTFVKSWYDDELCFVLVAGKNLPWKKFIKTQSEQNKWSDAKLPGMGGVLSFNSEYNSNNFVAFVFSKSVKNSAIKEPEDMKTVDDMCLHIEMAVNVGTDHHKPYLFHLGITRMPDYILKGGIKHSRISMLLHAFSAASMEKLFPDEKQYMICPPLPAMRRILLKGFRDGEYFLGHSETQDLLGKKLNELRSGLQNNNNASEFELKQVDKIQEIIRYIEKYPSPLSVNNLVFKSSYDQTESSEKTIEILPMGTNKLTISKTNKDGIEESYEVFKPNYSGDPVIGRWTPMSKEDTESRFGHIRKKGQPRKFKSELLARRSASYRLKVFLENGSTGESIVAIPIKVLAPKFVKAENKDKGKELINKDGNDNSN